MAFNTTTFSTSGLNLLAQLSSTKSLRIKHIYIDEIEHTASDFNQPPSWWASQTSATMAKVDAELSAASVISDQARLIVKLSLKQDQTTTVTAKTIVITACGVESGTESTEITFCGISDTTGIEAIYNASGVKVSTSVAIYFAFNNTSSITFADNIDPNFVIHSELDRFVSCHPIGDTSGGEAQTIGGVKTFNDGAVINITNSNKLSFQYDGDEQGWIGDTGNTGLQFMSINTAGGDVCFKFSDRNTSDIVTISRAGDGANERHLVEVDGNIEAESIIATTLRGTSVETNTCKIDGTALARMSNGLSIDGNFAPTTDNELRLGLPGKAWSQICGYSINVMSSIDIASQKAQNNMLHIIEDDGDLVLSGFLQGKGLHLGRMRDAHTPQLGAKASVYCGDIYAKDINASGDLTVSGVLHGVIPVPSSQTDIPVGSICVLRASTDTRRGDQFAKRPDEQGWLIRRTSSNGTEESANVNLSLGDLADATAGLALVYSDYTQSTRFMALSHAIANKSFLAIRTA